MTQGFLIFAHNNEHLDYAEIALCNAVMIRANSSRPVSLVTDAQSWDGLVRKHRMARSTFDHVIVVDPPRNQPRRFHDTTAVSREGNWRNGSRSTAYDLTPYDETIVVDADYLVMDRTLELCWGAREPLMMNRHAITLEHLPPPPGEMRLEPMGVPMYWATVVYFRKGDVSEKAFGIVDHVRENYDYYQHLYRFPGHLFRNDYAFSIAAHILGGWSEDGVPSLPSSTLLTSFDYDELVGVPAPNQLTFLVNDQSDRTQYRLNRVDGISVHVMNKFSIMRNAVAILEVYQ